VGSTRSNLGWAGSKDCAGCWSAKPPRQRPMTNLREDALEVQTSVSNNPKRQGAPPTKRSAGQYICALPPRIQRTETSPRPEQVFVIRPRRQERGNNRRPKAAAPASQGTAPPISSPRQNSCKSIPEARAPVLPQEVPPVISSVGAMTLAARGHPRLHSLYYCASLRGNAPPPAAPAPHRGGSPLTWIAISAGLGLGPEDGGSWL